jgi:hypothetical protein
LTVVEAPDAPGRSGGVGTAAALLAVDLLSLLAFLDFPAVVFFSTHLGYPPLSGAADELLAPP